MLQECPASQQHLPSTMSLAAWLWVLQAAPPGPSPPAVLLWDVQGYPAEQSAVMWSTKLMLCPVPLAPVTCLPSPEVQTLIAVSHSEEVNTKHLLG